jgi:polyhydroxybutyrate depolymerase
MQVAGMTGLYIVSIPPNYDPARAYPVGFGFHGRNRNHQNCRDGDCAGFQRELGGDHVLVYMQSLRTPTNNTMSGWESTEEREGNVDFFEAVLAVVKAEYCIDQRRVFVAGTSSGASFSNLLACRLGDQLLAVAPVSGGLPENRNCRGKPAAVVIHGIDDPHVTFQSGERARDFFRQQAGCSATTVPDIATMHADVRAARDAQPTVEKSGCVDYQGCGAGSAIRWCEHSYGGYDGSTHGWPPNGGKLIRDFVTAL